MLGNIELLIYKDLLHQGVCSCKLKCCLSGEYSVRVTWGVVPSTAAVFPLCMATEIHCSKWWNDRGSPRLFPDVAPKLKEECLCLLPKNPMVSMVTGTGVWQPTQHTLLCSSVQHGLPQHMPLGWPAAIGMGQRCPDRWCPRQGLVHSSMALQLPHLVPSHLIATSLLVPSVPRP